jgi:hypothetical protein
MSTTRRINASRANGALSRGPKTAAGKARTHLNALKTRAFAKPIVLNNESRARPAWRPESSRVNYKMAEQLPISGTVSRFTTPLNTAVG